MKLFWKLFLSIMTVIVMFAGIEGYVLIQNSFQSFLEKEQTELTTECGSLVAILEENLEQLQESYGLEQLSEEIIPELLTRISSNINIRTASGKLNFQILKQDGTKLYGSGSADTAASFSKVVSDSTIDCKVINSNGIYELHSAAGFRAGTEVFYAAVKRDISYIYALKKQQTEMFSIWMAVLLVIGTVIIFLISYYLSNPIRKLTNAAKTFAGGEKYVPIRAKGHDEVGILTREFNRMGKQITRNMEELQEESDRKELFIGNFAHELKTPLTSIIGYADMMRSKKLSEEELILFSNQIVQEGKRLEGMSMKLMELFVLKKQDFPLKPVFARDYLEDIALTMRPVFEKDTVLFNVSAETAQIHAEPDILKTACMNLLDNARKAVAHDGTGCVYLKGVLKDGCYEISILDNGCGIPEKEIRKIQEPFYMVDKARSRNNGGAGLGLAICTEIIRIHQGSLQIESKPGVGTKFTIRIQGEAL